MSDKPAEGEPEINAEPVVVETGAKKETETVERTPEVAGPSDAAAPEVASDVVDALTGKAATVEATAPEATPAAGEAAIHADGAATPEAGEKASVAEAAATNGPPAPDVGANVDPEAPVVDGAAKDDRASEGHKVEEAGADGQTADGKAGDGKATNGKADDGKAIDVDPKQEEMFKVYGTALENADWAFKAKTGDERELGHKSVMLAEKAYISAGLYDKEQADKMWSEATGRPPKAELQQRLAEAQGVDPSKGIADLSASLTTLKQKQDVNSISLNRDAADKQISAWEGALGDHQARQREFRHKAADELLKPEAPDRNDEGGLGMFLRSIKGGYRAGKDINMAAQHGARFNQVSENKSNAEQRYATLGEELKKAQGVLAGEPTEFVAEKGDGLEATVGDVGKNARRFPAVRSIVDKVMANKLAASMNKTPVQSAVEAVVNTEKVDAIDPARRNFIMARMADQGRGMNG